MHIKETKQRAMVLYSSGLSVREVTKRLVKERNTYVSPPTIARWMRELGSSRPVGEARSVELDKSAKRLYESGLNLDQVAKRCGVSRTTAAERLREMGVAIRPSGSRFLHVLTKERLRELYRDRRNTMQSIAERYGCSVGTVYRLLRQYDFHRNDQH